MSDTISRQAAIDALIKCGDYYDEDDEARRGVAQCIGTIYDLPSAQPDVPDTNVGDMISRREAIKAICEHGTDLERRGIMVLAVANHKQVTVDLLETLPSAQPEVLAHGEGELSAQTEEDCDTCKHGYFGGACCNNCKVRFPSHYERRTR